MQNFELLKALGKLDKPVLLKRGWANTVKELLTSAEHIMSGGNEQIVLCERGIRTFETATRNTLDLSAVAVIKDLSRLPVIVDPSHATGHRDSGAVCRHCRKNQRTAQSNFLNIFSQINFLTSPVGYAIIFQRRCAEVPKRPKGLPC